jgi:hypothetical protein
LADKPGGLDMIDFACEVVGPGATICTDGARMFTRLTPDAPRDVVINGAP